MKLCIEIQQVDNGYRAVCRSLPGCVSRGNTPDEATEKLDQAIRGYLAALGNFEPERVEHEIVEA